MKGHKQSKPAKTPKLSDLPLKWQVFLMAWLTNGGNAIQAATQAGIKAPESSAYRVLENARFKAVKNQMVADRLADKETLLLRLGEMFSHNPAMFLINQFGKWRLNTKVFKEKAYLVRRFQVNPDGSVSIRPYHPK